MKVKKIKIISNNICYGPKSSPEDEVEQHLIISSDGRVWFTGYNYAGGFGNYKVGRNSQFSIGKLIADKILSLFSQYCIEEPLSCFATDIGEWEMIITDIEQKTYVFKGSLCGGVSAGDVDLTDYIREHISIDDMFVFILSYNLIDLIYDYF